MRSPHHLTIKKDCLESIPSLMQKHQLGETSSIRQDTDGWVNPCFFVNDSYVFRFNARDPELPKYQREKIIFELLRDNLSIPVPREVILDADHKETPYDVLISKVLPGFNLEQRWPKLKNENRSVLAFKAGVLLKKIHSNIFDYYGEISDSGPLQKHSSWSEFLKSKLAYLLMKAREVDVFTDDQERLIKRKFQSHESLLQTIKTSRLVHVDFHFGNLLFQDQDLTGVFDFEWAFAGDPLYDLVFWKGSDQYYQGSESSFFKGYGLEHFNPKELKLMALYQMIKNIELSIVARNHFPVEEALSYKQTTLEQIQKIDLIN